MNVASFRLLFMIVRDDPPQVWGCQAAAVDWGLAAVAAEYRGASIAVVAPRFRLRRLPACLVCSLLQLEGSEFSTDFKDFVWQCLRKVCIVQCACACAQTGWGAVEGSRVSPPARSCGSACARRKSCCLGLLAGWLRFNLRGFHRALCPLAWRLQSALALPAAARYHHMPQPCTALLTPP